MKSHLTIFAFGLLGITLGCATGPTPADLPGWCQKAGLGQGVGQLTYFGRADGAASSAEALKLATGNALSQLTSELGLSVSSESTLEQSERNGVLSTNVRASLKTATKSVEIRGMQQTRAETLELSAGHTGCVAVQVTSDEKARLVRLARNRSALTLFCKTKSLGEGSCPTDAVNRINAILSQRGAQLLPVVETGKLSNAFISNALKSDAASAFEIVVDSRPLDVVNGEHYAEASLSLKQIDTADQKSILSIQIEPQKGGHYSDRDAELAAIIAALTALEEALAGKSL